MNKKLIVLFLMALFVLIPFLGVKADEPIVLTQAMFNEAYDNYNPGEGDTGTDSSGIITFYHGSAGEDYTVAAGDYSLGEDITLKEADLDEDMEPTIQFAGVSTLNLNGHTLNCDVVAYDDEADLTISGTGTVTGHARSYTGANLTVNGGTYGGFYSWRGTILIKNATVDTEEDYAIWADDGANITVEDGSFSADDYAILISSDSYAADAVIVKGGTFEGTGTNGVGIWVSDVEDVETLLLSGGTFSGTLSSFIAWTGEEEDADIFDSYLADYCYYSPALDPETYSELGNYHTNAGVTEVTVIAPHVYEFLEGENLVYTINKDMEAKFEIDASFAELFEDGGVVYVDDDEVDPSNYTATSGSTIITFKKEFMAALGAGEHILTVVFNNGGYAETTFTIKEAAPETGDTVAFYIGLLILSMAGFAGIKYYTRKRAN